MRRGARADLDRGSASSGRIGQAIGRNSDRAKRVSGRVGLRLASLSLALALAAAGCDNWLTKPGLYTGLFPLDENAVWEKNAASLKQLNSLRERLKNIEKSTKS